MNSNELYNQFTDEDEKVMPEIMTAIYGSGADANADGKIDSRDLYIFAKEEDQKDGYWGNSLWGKYNADHVTDSDLDAVIAKAKALDTSTPPPAPAPKPAGPKPYKAKDCATTKDPYAKSTATDRSRWQKIQAGISDMNQLVKDNTDANHVVTVQSGMTLSLIAKSLLHDANINPGDATYKAKLKELSDKLVYNNGCNTNIDVNQQVDVTDAIALIP